MYYIVYVYIIRYYNEMPWWLKISILLQTMNLTNKSVRMADLSTINNSEYRVVSGYFRGYP
jgi:hypothetical protein